MLYQTRYLSWRCRWTSQKPRSRRSELEKGDLHAFLFETIVRLTYPQKRIMFTKTTANLWDDSFGKNNGEHMGGPRAMKAPLREVKSWMPDTVTSARFFFACVHHVGLAYISSDLRTCTQRMFARNTSANVSFRSTTWPRIFFFYRSGRRTNKLPTWCNCQWR